MIPVVRTKEGVDYTSLAPAGIAILSALNQAATKLGYDLTVTSACDGTHSGPEDPHHKGEALDVRSKDCPDKDEAFTAIMSFLPEGRFFGWLENKGEDNEHFHFQRKKDTVYP